MAVAREREPAELTKARERDARESEPAEITKKPCARERASGINEGARERAADRRRAKEAAACSPMRLRRRPPSLSLASLSLASFFSCLSEVSACSSRARSFLAAATAAFSILFK